MNDVDWREDIVVGSGNEKFQSFSLGKIDFECVDWTQLEKNIITPSKKMVKETPPKKSTPHPQSVEGID